MKKTVLVISCLALAGCGSQPEQDQETIDISAEFSTSDTELISICEPIQGTVFTVFHKNKEYAFLMVKEDFFGGTKRLARRISSKEFALNFCKGN